MNSRNHDILWEEIVSKMNEKDINATKLQVINKWKNMKKKYKDVKDNNLKTGSNPISWKHLGAFDEIFGHKESTRLSVIIDSGKEKKLVQIDTEKCFENQSESTSDSNLPGPSKRKSTNSKTSHKDKLLRHLEKLEERQQDALKKEDDHHNARMERMDKLLTIFERAVDKMPENKK